RVLPEIVVFERLMPLKQQLVHGPETVLQGSCLGSRRRPERLRTDLDEREVPEGEPNAPAQFLLDLFDRPKRLPGVGALVVAVLENEASSRRPAGVVDSSSNGTKPGRTSFGSSGCNSRVLLVGIATRVRPAGRDRI